MITSFCEDCSEYIKFIYSKIVFYPEQLQVSFQEGDVLVFTITCNEKDDGIIIGKQGATIQSVRLFVHAYSKAKIQGIPCIIEVRDHRRSNYNPFNKR